MDNFSYFRISAAGDKVELSLLNLRDEDFRESIGHFDDEKEARNWIDTNHKGIPIHSLAFFSNEYRDVYEEINSYILEKFEEQKLALLVTKSGKTIEKLLLMGISFDEESEGDKSVTLINHHFLVDSDEKMFIAHLIVFHDSEIETKEEYTQYDTVVPFFHNGSYFENGEYVVDIQGGNEFLDSLFGDKLFGETLAKIKENKAEELEIAKFLEEIDYPKILKFKTGWKDKIQTAYMNMLNEQKKI